MLKRLQRPPRVIPRRDQNHAMNIFRAQPLEGELSILPRRHGIALNLDGGGGHALLQQDKPVDFVVTRSGYEDARRSVLLEEFRRTVGALLMHTAAENDNDIRRNIFTTIQAQDCFRIKKRHQEYRCQ